MDDQALLKQYCTEGDHEAFGELVRRHVTLVFSTALNHLTDPSLAEDATQMVFTRLAQRAHRLPKNVILAGWLHADTRLTSLQLLRTEQRRKMREREALAMQELTSNSELDWAQIRPVLDEALEKLGQTDRDLLLLRFFEQRSLRDVGAALGLGEDATRMRVARALTRLRDSLLARGISTAGEGLALALTTYSIQATPPTLAATVTASALAASAPAAGTVLGLIAMSKAKLVIIGSLLATGIVTPLVWQYQLNSSLRAQNQALRSEIQELRAASDNAQRQFQTLRAESQRLRGYENEVARLRGTVAQLHQQLDTPKRPLPVTSELQPAPGNNDDIATENPVSEAELAAFLQRPKSEQGDMLGHFRRQIMGQEKPSPADFAHNRALATQIRHSLEDLESHPEDFADFQSSFIKTTIDLQDEQKLAQIRQIVQQTYQKAAADKLDANSRPVDEVDAWALRRDVLDRQATRAVQELLTPEERARFDRAFLGVMGIDLGLNDGAWHRFVLPDGGITFPSEER